MTANSIQLHLTTKKILWVALAITVTTVILVMLQDFLQSSVNGYSYYLSESLLFNSVWLFYLPIGILLYRLVKFMSGADHQIHYTLLLVTMAIGIHMLVFPLFVWAFSAIGYDHTYDFVQVLKYNVSHYSYQYLITYTLLGYLWYQQQKLNEEKKRNIGFRKAITLTKGTKNILLPTSSIFYIKANSPYIAYHTSAGKYLQLNTLKSIQSELDPDQSIRIHKSTLINMNEVQGFKSRLNGDYDIVLKNGESLRLSRGYSKAFKEKISDKPTA